MFQIASSVISIGLERFSSGFLKGATVEARLKGPVLKQLFILNPAIDDVKRLYTHQPFLTTGLDGIDVLVRYLRLPLTKDQDIQEALAFQAEPLLPYDAEQAFLAHQTLAKDQEGTDLVLLAVRKESVQKHIEQWQDVSIEPEKIACVQSALCRFGATYLSATKIYLILHMQQHTMTCVLIKEGKLMASFGQQEGLGPLFTAQTAEGLESLPQEEAEWQAMSQQNHSLGAAVKRLQRTVTKMGYALAKELRGESIEGIAVTGEAADWKGLDVVLVQPLNLPLMSCEPVGEFSAQDLLSYAVPIGLAIGSLPGQTDGVDFRQQELSYPYPWMRLKTPLIAYFVASLLLSLAFYFFSQHYLAYQEDQIRQTYVELLAGMGKAYDQFETEFMAKNPQARADSDGQIMGIQDLTQEDLIERLNFVQKDLQSTPDSFPLFANIPRVSDVLAWLTQHPAVAALDEKGNPQTRLQIESFNYTMVKRPQQSKKQDKYQVKVELELTSSTPKWAREFHDALIAPNEWVDPKGEIKWSANRGKYKTSFYLKDKTLYPSS
jgi:type IV pilus assembly protein PilM